MCRATTPGLVGLFPKLDPVARLAETGAVPIEAFVDRLVAMMIDGMRAR